MAEISRLDSLKSSELEKFNDDENERDFEKVLVSLNASVREKELLSVNNFECVKYPESGKLVD